MRARSRRLALGGDDERWPYGLAINPQWPGSAQRHDSATDRERSARPIRRFRTCHSDDSINVIEKVTGAAEKHFQRAALRRRAFCWCYMSSS